MGKNCEKTFLWRGKYELALTNEDLNKIKEVFEPRFQGIEFRFQEQDSKLASMDRKLENLIRTSDEFLHIVRRDDVEFVAIRAPHEKMRNGLIKKGIASEDELSVTS